MPAIHSADGGVQAVLFDLDGTLVDTRRLYLECYRRAVEPRLGRAPRDEEMLARKPRSEIRFLRALVGAAEIDACLAEFHALYDELHASHFDGVFDGVPALLRRLRERRFRLGLVTGKSERSWRVTAPVAALGDFDVVVLDDHVAEPKPSPEGIRQALAALKVEPGRAVYVGDTVSDALAARDAGVQPIAALWARSRRGSIDRFVARLRPHDARLAHQPRDVLDHVDGAAGDPAPH